MEKVEKKEIIQSETGVVPRDSFRSVHVVHIRDITPRFPSLSFAAHNAEVPSELITINSLSFSPSSSPFPNPSPSGTERGV